MRTRIEKVGIHMSELDGPAGTVFNRICNLMNSIPASRVGFGEFTVDRQTNMFELSYTRPMTLDEIADEKRDAEIKNIRRELDAMAERKAKFTFRLVQLLSDEDEANEKVL